MNENLKLRAICKNSTAYTTTGLVSSVQNLFDASERLTKKIVNTYSVNSEIVHTKFDWNDDISNWPTQPHTLAQLSQCIQLMSKKKNRVKDAIEFDEALGIHIPVMKTNNAEARVNSASAHVEMIPHRKPFSRDVTRYPNRNNNNNNPNAKYRRIGSGNQHFIEQQTPLEPLNQENELTNLTFPFKNMLRINKINQNHIDHQESTSFNNGPELCIPKRVLDETTKEKLEYIRRKFAEVLNDHSDTNNNNDNSRINPKEQNFAETPFSRTPILAIQDTSNDILFSKLKPAKNSIYSKHYDQNENQKYQNNNNNNNNNNRKKQDSLGEDLQQGSFFKHVHDPNEKQQRFRNYHQHQQQSAPLLTVYSNFKQFNANDSTQNHFKTTTTTSNSTDITLFTTNATHTPTSTLATTVLPPIIAGKRINLPQTQQRKHLAYLDGFKASHLNKKKTIAPIDGTKQDGQKLLNDPPTIK